MNHYLVRKRGRRLEVFLYCDDEEFAREETERVYRNNGRRFLPGLIQTTRRLRVGDVVDAEDASITVLVRPTDISPIGQEDN
jgi:hypothetical protein